MSHPFDMMVSTNLSGIVGGGADAAHGERTFTVAISARPDHNTGRQFAVKLPALYAGDADGVWVKRHVRFLHDEHTPCRIVIDGVMYRIYPWATGPTTRGTGMSTMLFNPGIGDDTAKGVQDHPLFRQMIIEWMCSNQEALETDAPLSAFDLTSAARSIGLSRREGEVAPEIMLGNMAVAIIGNSHPKAAEQLILSRDTQTGIFVLKRRRT